VPGSSTSTSGEVGNGGAGIVGAVVGVEGSGWAGVSGSTLGVLGRVGGVGTDVGVVGWGWAGVSRTGVAGAGLGTSATEAGAVGEAGASSVEAAAGVTEGNPVGVGWVRGVVVAGVSAVSVSASKGFRFGLRLSSMLFTSFRSKIFFGYTSSYLSFKIVTTLKIVNP
jgi:hypothetical protein